MDGMGRWWGSVKRESGDRTATADTCWKATQEATTGMQEDGDGTQLSTRAEKTGRQPRAGHEGGQSLLPSCLPPPHPPSKPSPEKRVASTWLETALRAVEKV